MNNCGNCRDYDRQENTCENRNGPCYTDDKLPQESCGAWKGKEPEWGDFFMRRFVAGSRN